MADGPGQVIARQYRLVEEIGRGGFGVVWRARDERLHRDVAAKELFLPSYLAADQRQERRDRSLREARSAARIYHRAAVTVYDVVEHDGCPWIIMELIDGRALNTIVKTQGPLSPRRTAQIGLEILGALQAAHHAGVVHRDVKPGNVLIGENRVVLTDFGIATIDGDPALTHSGFVMGAPAYTAPERARGEHAVNASDLWSLGATLFYAVEGHRPYPGANANAVFNSILNGTPARPLAAGPLTPIIEGLLQKNINDRMTADEAAKLLGDIVRDERLERLDIIQSARDRHGRNEPTHPVPRFLSGRRKRVTLGLTLGILAAALPFVIGGMVWSDDSQAPYKKDQLRAQAPTGPHLAATLLGSTDQVYAVAFSPDGRTLASSGEDNLIRLWDVTTRTQIAALKGHSHSVFTAAFSPDGKTLATGGYDESVMLWHVEDHTRTATLHPDQGTISSVSFSPDGKTLAIAGTDNVQLWNVRKHTRTKTVTRPDEHQFTATYSDKGTLGIASTDTIKVRGTGQTPRTTTVTRPASLIRAMAFSPNGKILACGGDSGTLTLWNPTTKTRLGTLTSDKSVFSVAFSPNGQTLATTTGNTITLWNTAKQTKEATLKAHQDLVSSLAFSPDGKTLATAAYDNTIRLWTMQ